MLVRVWSSSPLTHRCLSSSLLRGGVTTYQNCVKSVLETSVPSGWHQISVFPPLSVRLLGEFQFFGIQCLKSLIDKGGGAGGTSVCGASALLSEAVKKPFENRVPSSGNCDRQALTRLFQRTQVLLHSWGLQVTLPLSFELLRMSYLLPARTSPQSLLLRSPFSAYHVLPLLASSRAFWL